MRESSELRICNVIVVPLLILPTFLAFSASEDKNAPISSEQSLNVSVSFFDPSNAETRIHVDAISEVKHWAKSSIEELEDSFDKLAFDSEKLSWPNKMDPIAKVLGAGLRVIVVQTGSHCFCGRKFYVFGKRSYLSRKYCCTND